MSPGGAPTCILCKGAGNGRIEGEIKTCARCYGTGNDPHTKADLVNHPSHYNTGKIEVIEFIEDQRLGFHLGNAVKYVSRAGKKDPAREKEDLEKAIWYIRRHLETLSPTPRRPNEMPQERA